MNWMARYGVGMAYKIHKGWHRGLKIAEIIGGTPKSNNAAGMDCCCTRIQFIWNIETIQVSYKTFAHVMAIRNADSKMILIIVIERSRWVCHGPDQDLHVMRVRPVAGAALEPNMKKWKERLALMAQSRLKSERNDWL